jgi:hypothetical protein
VSLFCLSPSGFRVLLRFVPSLSWGIIVFHSLRNQYSSQAYSPPAAAWLAGPTFFANVSAILPPSVIRFNWIHDAGDHESALLDHGGIGEGSHAPGGIYTDE